MLHMIHSNDAMQTDGSSPWPPVTDSVCSGMADVLMSVHSSCDQLAPTSVDHVPSCCCSSLAGYSAIPPSCGSSCMSSGPPAHLADACGPDADMVCADRHESLLQLRLTSEMAGCMPGASVQTSWEKGSASLATTIETRINTLLNSVADGGKAISALDVFEWHTLKLRQRCQLSKEELPVLLEITDAALAPEIRMQVQYVVQMLEYLDIAHDQLQAMCLDVSKFLQPLVPVVVYAFAQRRGLNFADWYRYVMQCRDDNSLGVWEQCRIKGKQLLPKQKRPLMLSHLTFWYKKHFCDGPQKVRERAEWRAICSRFCRENNINQRVLYYFMNRTGGLTNLGKTSLRRVRQVDNGPTFVYMYAPERAVPSSSMARPLPSGRRQRSSGLRQNPATRVGKQNSSGLVLEWMDSDSSSSAQGSDAEYRVQESE